ncbi:MAG: aminotransferase class III-fold pyridoxal phosphate-dependent enzyme [Gammaproteobacteria bacterium]|nr:MAG: aminotransferase class III-fold pyridoxal phosphate-dependent enzyme [Gammaproteobacteria bacterium]
MDHAEVVRRNKAYSLADWVPQNQWNPLSMSKAEGVYFWDADGKRYLDWSSQLFNVNIGHSHPHVIQAVQDQVARAAYASPDIATETRAQLGEMLADLTPGNLRKTFFTLGGSDAVEAALKMARMATGRQKIVARYRAYHGATFGAMSVGGDPRRLANEPGVPWVIRVHDPYAYRSPLYRGRSEDEGDRALVDQIEETIQFEGPGSVAAILLEGYSGTSGVIQGGEQFWRGMQSICDRYDILLIVDEVLSGFGRTGEWFGINHYPYVEPDFMVLAKGLTSGYVPLGAVVVSAQVAAHFDNETLSTGLTLGAHAVGCAAAIANIEVYQKENLVDQASKLGVTLRKGLMDLAEEHRSVGDVRGVGLLQVVELVKDRRTREPLSPFNAPLSEPMQRVSASLRESGMNTVVRWNWIFSAPPLIINEEQIREGLEIMDRALSVADKVVAD